jgi:hypothetical protein
MTYKSCCDSYGPHTAECDRAAKRGVIQQLEEMPLRTHARRARAHCQRACFTTPPCEPQAKDACPICRVADYLEETLCQVIGAVQALDAVEAEGRLPSKGPVDAAEWLDKRQHAIAAVLNAARAVVGAR